MYSNTYIFAFAKELLRVPNDCSKNVSQYIAVCVVHSSVLAWIYSVHVRINKYLKKDLRSEGNSQ